MRGFGLLLVLLASAAGCRDRASPAPSAPDVAPTPLVVEFAGCDGVRAGNVCELTANRALRLWTAHPDSSSIRVVADGRDLAALKAAVEGGTALSVEVPASTKTLTVLARAGAASSQFDLKVVAGVRTPALDDAEALRRAGKLDDAQKLIDPLLSSAEPLVRSRARRKLGRIERARGNVDRATALLREAIGSEREQGAVSEELEDRFALAYTLLYSARRFGEARTVLDDALPIAGSWPEGQVMIAYYRGLLAYETGDLRAAFRSFRESRYGAVRLAMHSHRFDVLQLLAEVMAVMGRHDDSFAALDEARSLLSPDIDPCRKAAFLNNTCWIARRTPAERRPPLATSACTTQLLEAVELFRSACPSPREQANVLTNLALDAYDAGRVDDARKWIADARKAAPNADASVEMWWLVLEGHLARERGRPKDALRTFERLAEIGRASDLAEARVEAALGQAQSLDALGRVEPAREAFRRAETELEAWSRLVPLGEGRESFLARHDHASQLRLEFLVRLSERPAGPGAKEGLPPLRSRWSLPAEQEASARNRWARSSSQDALQEAVDALRLSRGRLLRLLRGLDAVGNLANPDRERWEAALAAYRRRREAHTAKAAEDWRLPTDELERVGREREAELAGLRAALDEALGQLGAPSLKQAPNGPSARPAPPREGEVLLAYGAVPHGWVAFCATAQTIRVQRLAAIDPAATSDALASAMLAPFHDEISSARRIRIAADGRVERVDVHALPFDGKPLLERATVVYGYDLPGVAGDPVDASAAQGALPDAGVPPVQGPSRRALVVGDPRGDLQAARREAVAVRDALAASGWQVDVLEGTSARHAAVRDALEKPGLSLFHYAGHGKFDGRDGWRSALPLTSRGWFDVGDILALTRAPRNVVLSGCDTARSSGGGPAAGLGLAQAFLLAGSSSVMAASRPVDDRLASRLTQAFVASLATMHEPDPSEALRHAQRVIAAATPNDDWASFRVLAR